MIANFVTLLRVVLSFIAIYLLALGSSLANLFGILLIVIAMLLDIVDGVAARHFKSASFKGSVYDILGDRIIENIFFIYFATQACFGVWFALIIVLRGLSVDATRTIFASQGKTAFGETSWHTRGWMKLLICSKLSRALYNALKLSTFISYAALLQPSSPIFNTISFSGLHYLASLFLWSTVIFSLIRTLPVLLDGWILTRIKGDPSPRRRVNLSFLLSSLHAEIQLTETSTFHILVNWIPASCRDDKTKKFLKLTPMRPREDGIK